MAVFGLWSRPVPGDSQRCCRWWHGLPASGCWATELSASELGPCPPPGSRCWRWPPSWPGQARQPPSEHHIPELDGVHSRRLAEVLAMALERRNYCWIRAYKGTLWVHPPSPRHTPPHRLSCGSGHSCRERGTMQQPSNRDSRHGSRVGVELDMRDDSTERPKHPM